ncbi:DUF1684 domain-containing protein [Chryseolinea sp. H1M3-3]|uniref:DUF1684 domain-containing protein n=1 Tax=Chryseolinea sp. H1M3-3 TaxID=3034144 RepID=UPI0023EB772B|nr:DUF1684 domain-containing protein [Chryseolinea sp. H1M3-3]
MKTQNIILLIAAAVIIVSVFYSFMGGSDESAYTAEINKEREEKDRFMRTSTESPFAADPDAFKGLSYYPPNLRYKIIADLSPVQNKKLVTLTTNTGEEQQYSEYAYAEFDLDGYHHKLLILEVIAMGPQRGKLFFAFGDETSAVETYGAGRYLDVAKVPGSNTITLDFNKAYNPYCAYSDKFSCPLPPAENLLHIAIKAGEKAYH